MSQQTHVPLLLAVVAACGQTPQRHEPSADAARAASSTRLQCLSPDSGRIAYGVIERAPETEDASGVQFSFEVRDDYVRGYYRDARGEIPREAPLQDVVLDPLTDTLSFWYASSRTTRYLFRYHASCDRLSGEARLFVTDDSPGMLKPDTVPRARYIAAP